MSYPVVAVCTHCGRGFHTASGPLGGLCDVPMCRGLIHWIDRTRVPALGEKREPGALTQDS